MNIAQAKEQIRNAVTAYRTRNMYGRPATPPQRQRPLFLMGAPGIGKTAIVEQVAQEMGIALVSYSMTHHTRQSALGLPYIREKRYGEKVFRVSEYTMSEIIGAVYDKMEETGLKEGILFLDEINCVSETLAPAMLQFLQYKVFGQHRVPEGWIIVTAGNPPEYNRAVREFDMVTWDRLKRIDIEPDMAVWRAWAQGSGVHPAVISYLDIHPEDFCRTEATADGRSFVTPRGWTDLSDMMRLYALNGLAVDGLLIGQYLQEPHVAARFAHYWGLWQKYQADYRVPDILAGRADAALLNRARAAAFDERLSLVRLLLDGLHGSLAPVMARREALEALLPYLKALASDEDPGPRLEAWAAEVAGAMERGVRGGTLAPREEARQQGLLAALRALCGAADTAAVRDRFAQWRSALAAEAAAASAQLEHLLAFCEAAFGEGQELLLAVTELTASPEAAGFIGTYGSEAYYRHNKALLFDQRQQAVARRIDRLLEADDQT